MHVIRFRLPTLESTAIVGTPVWIDSLHICALADAERHLGHAVEDHGWHAYDAIHGNGFLSGLRYLGRFADLTAAKGALEAALGRFSEEKVLVARVNGSDDEFSP